MEENSLSKRFATLDILKKSPDILLGVAVVAILLMMVFPLPAFLLDMLLAASISVALVILMVSIYIMKPLEFGVFPTLLLICTLFRLSLNVATTRSILLHGNDSTGISNLIKAFGNVVIADNTAVGLVVFIILMIINFVVITKGSGRIAEVAARFTLDAMPGKQMAIDAELNAGHIDTETAQKRRKAIERETDFYGAMDGSSKFVRGDAIAGIIITIVNMLVGLAVGILQHGLSFGEAASTFTLLAVGDGLISAIPALMISTAAGIIVTRATSEGNLGDQVVGQFREHHKAFYAASGLLLLLSVIPGFPTLAFIFMGGVFVTLGYVSKKAADDRKEKENMQQEGSEEQKEESIESLMKVDILSVEVGHGIVNLIDPDNDGEVVERIQSIRKQFAQDLGVIVPQIQLRDNLQLDPGKYIISLKGSKIASGVLLPDYWLAMDPGNIELPIEGESIEDPVYGLPAIWVHEREKDDAMIRGYTVVNGATVIATHITKVLQDHSSSLLTRQDVQEMIDRVKETHPKAVEEVVGADKLSLGDITKVFQNLLAEEVSIRDILTLFECLGDHCGQTKNPDVLAEQCRKALGRAITSKFLDEEDELNVLVFDRQIEDILMAALVVSEGGSTYLNIDAQVAQGVLEKLMKAVQVFDLKGTIPVLLCTARLRLSFYQLAHRYLPALAILSYDEIPGDVKVNTLEVVS